MEKTKTVNISHHSDDPNVGLGSTEELMQYKMFVGDTGLFVTLAFKDKTFTENVIYKHLLNDKLSTNLGYLYDLIYTKDYAHKESVRYIPAYLAAFL